MKIAHLVSTYPPYQGGQGNVCFHQVKELRALGHQVFVFTPQNIFSAGPQTMSEEVVYLKSLVQFGNAAFIPQIVKLLKDFDLIYLHWPFIGGAENILCQKKKLPFLAVQYHMDLVGHGWRGLFFKIYQLFFLPRLVSRAEKIIVSSWDYILTSALKKFLPKYKEKFIELPLGVDLKFFFPQTPDQQLKKQLGLKPEDKIILFVAGLDQAHYFKGLNVLLTAIAKIKKDIKLIVGGEGDLKKKYQQTAIDLGITEKVIFTGALSGRQLTKFYNLADVLVLPSTSRSEAFGLVLLEAMACAKPIITSDLPGPRTLVQEGENGFLVKPNDADDLAKKIELILFNHRSKEMGERAKKLVEEKYDWKKIVEKLEQTLLKVRNYGNFN